MYAVPSCGMEKGTVCGFGELTEDGNTVVINKLDPLSGRGRSSLDLASTQVRIWLVPVAPKAAKTFFLRCRASRLLARQDIPHQSIPVSFGLAVHLQNISLERESSNMDQLDE
jgi:hypothetical protein